MASMRFGNLFSSLQPILLKVHAEMVLDLQSKGGRLATGVMCTWTQPLHTCIFSYPVRVGINNRSSRILEKGIVEKSIFHGLSPEFGVVL